MDDDDINYLLVAGHLTHATLVGTFGLPRLVDLFMTYPSFSAYITNRGGSMLMDYLVLGFVAQEAFFIAYTGSLFIHSVLPIPGLQSIGAFASSFIGPRMGRVERPVYAAIGLFDAGLGMFGTSVLDSNEALGRLVDDEEPGTISAVLSNGQRHVVEWRMQA